MDYLSKLKDAKQTHDTEFALLENLYKRGDIDLTACMSLMKYSDDKYAAEAHLLRGLHYSNVKVDQKGV